MISRFLPTLKVHCWGGLGSQLYAWALYERLTLKYPRRRIILVFHTGGVTERVGELGSFFPNSQIVQDYVRLAAGSKTSIKSSIGWTRKLGKLLIPRFGFISSCNNEHELHSLKPWVLQIRGHYSDLLIPQDVLNQILRSLGTMSVDGRGLSSSEYLGIHVRLGDLLTLSDKSPTSPESVRNILCELALRYPHLNLVAFSDSPKLIRDFLGGSTPESITIVDDGAWETLIMLSESKVMIGTSSKISIWAVLLGVARGNLSVGALPRNLRPKVLLNLGMENHGHVQFY
jgi:hypothetical protein